MSFERARPSAHGKILGEALADIAEHGARDSADLPTMCSTCAFRRGSMPNQMAPTLVEAMHCVLGSDEAEFACHHGLVSGEPTRPCAGYAAARLASFEVARNAIVGVEAKLAAIAGRPDTVRETTDAWIACVDPDGRMDDYQRARAWAVQSGAALRTSTPPPTPDLARQAAEATREAVVTSAMIDAGAKTLRETLQGGKTLKPWADTPNATKRKWLVLSEVTLRAALPLPQEETGQ